MAKSLLSLVSTSGGQVSPKLDARVDQQKYGQWMRTCRNMIPYRTGGLTRAPGTLQVALAKVNGGTGTSVRMVPFTFSSSTAFALEFGADGARGYVRFYSNDQQVVLSSAPIWVSFATTGIYTKPGTFVEDPTDANNIYYYEGFFGQQGIASVVAPSLDPANWVKQSIYEVPTPYGTIYSNDSFDSDVFRITPCQINDVIYISSPNYAPVSLTRIADTNWVAQYVPFLSPALLDQNASNTTISASGTTGNMFLTATAPAWVGATYYYEGNSVSNGGILYDCAVSHLSGAVFADDLALGYWTVSTIFQFGHIGSVWQLGYLVPASYLEVVGVAATGFANATSSTIKVLGPYTINTYGVWSSDIAIQRSDDNGVTWTTIQTLVSRSDANFTIEGSTEQRVLFRFAISNGSALVTPGTTNPRIVIRVGDAFVYGLVKINPGFPTAYSASATVITQLESTAATLYWSEAAWSGVRGYPQAVTSFQQRMIYGGTSYEPQRIWGSVTNDLENFDRTDPSLATNGFAFDLNAPGRGPIQWLIGQSDLFVGLNGAEWVVNSGQTSSNASVSGAAITATAINAIEQGSFGSASNVQPVVVGNSAFFVQRQADALRQIQFSFYTNKYQSQDLCALADDLFTSRIAQIAYQTRWRHQGLVWAVTKQGTLCGLTYDVDGEIGGWCERDTGYGQLDTAGAPLTPDKGFESVAVLPGAEGEDDQVWVVVNRLVAGQLKRFIELVNPNNWEETFVGAPTPPTAVLADAYYVDCGVVVNNPGSIFVTSPLLANIATRTVCGLADGYAFGPIEVAFGGIVALPESFGSDVAKVVVGLPIHYMGQPMRIDMDARQGNTQALNKSVSDVFVRVWNSVGGSIGNGTSEYPWWFSGTIYVYGTKVKSPDTLKSYQCLVTGVSVIDPSLDTTNWQLCPSPSYQQPVPIPYTPMGATPFAMPAMVTEPTDIRIQPQMNPTPGADPTFIVQGEDALPLTVLALVLKYDISSTP